MLPQEAFEALSVDAALLKDAAEGTERYLASLRYNDRAARTRMTWRYE